MKKIILTILVVFFTTVFPFLVGWKYFDAKNPLAGGMFSVFMWWIFVFAVLLCYSAVSELVDNIKSNNN
jgi:hypothetical protein